MEIIVGRKGNQSFTITDMSVSGKHLKLTVLPDGNVEVEDLGSSNGTFIDGVKIIKKVVSRNTTIQMGSRYTFKVSDVFPETPKASAPLNTPLIRSVVTSSIVSSAPSERPLANTPAVPFFVIPSTSFSS